MKKGIYIKWIAAFISVMLIFVMALNTMPLTAHAAGAKAKSITLNYSSYTLKKGKTVKLKAVIKPKKAQNKKLVWKSSKKAVASVNNQGIVKGKKKGSTTITVTVKGTSLKASCKVNVGTPVKKISVKNKKINMKVGAATVIKAVITPKSATNKALTYKSSNPKVVSVNNKGRLTAKGTGTAKITVQAKDGSGKKAVVTVTVKKAEAVVTSVKVTVEKTEIKVGETTTASAEIMPADALVKTVTWSSSDQSVATVDKDGKITGVKAGEVTITASSVNGKKGSIKIHVKEEAATPSVVPTETPSVEPTGTPGETPTATPTPTPSNPSTPGTNVPVVTPPPAEILPSEVILNKTVETIAVGGEVTLQATVVPANAANKNVIWSSSDESVAVVDHGKVTGAALGTAVITAKTEAGGKTASCEITVGTVTEVASFAAMMEALEAGNADKIVCNSQESEFEIPEADYEKTVLVINAPNATITNHAKFKKIEILAIKSDTWIEKATGNMIDLTAKQSHVKVEGENVIIQVGPEAEKVYLEKEGTISHLMVHGASAIAISGGNRTSIPVVVRADGTAITTSIPVAVDTANDIRLRIRTGAESSSVQIIDSSVRAEIQGIGTIPVTNRQTNETKDVVAENVPPESGEEEEAIKGAITGNVYDETHTAVVGAVVYVIPYRSSVDKDNLEAAIEAAQQQERCYIVNTVESGKYTTQDIPYGNYVLIVKADDLQTYFQTVILNHSLINNGEITMTVPTQDRGDIQGTLYNAVDRSNLPAGITLRLRAGADNVTGSIAAQTTTDENGHYIFKDLLPGTYTVQAEDSRTNTQVHYARTTFNVVALANTTVQGDMALTEEMEDGQFRFILWWGPQSEAIPSDLDSHLVGPRASGNWKFHTYFGDREYGENGTLYADLDLDDIDWEGPETTTVYQAVDGLYHFYIHDFSNQGDSDNQMLADSQARVIVTIGSWQTAYYVPDQIGTLWDVCTYDSKTNTLTPVNKVTFHAGGVAEIGMDPIDIAKHRLIESIEIYENYDYGDALRNELAQKLEEARNALEQANDYEDVNAADESLNEYFYGLRESTGIDNLEAEGLKNYEITRQGNWYYGDEEDIQLNGYSVITLRGTGANILDNLSISLSDTEAVTQMLSSDRAEYEKLLVVTNSRTRAVEKYYLECKEYVPSLFPRNIEDQGNYISDFDTEYSSDEEGNPIDYLDIYGENEVLTNPVFSFESPEIQYNYTSTTENGAIGKLEVSYKDTNQIYYVRYIRKGRKVQLEAVKADGAEFTVPESDWVYDKETDSEYEVYTFSGTKDVLDQTVIPEVYVYNEEYDREFVSLDSWTLEPVEGAVWNYVLRTSYKGREQNFYLQYQKVEVLPEPEAASIRPESPNINEEIAVDMGQNHESVNEEIDFVQ